MVSGIDWDNSFDLNQQLHLPSTQNISSHYGRYIFIVDSVVKKNYQLGLCLSFLCQICYDFIDGAVPASSLSEICRYHPQAAIWDSAIYEIKTNLA